MFKKINLHYNLFWKVKAARPAGYRWELITNPIFMKYRDIYRFVQLN